MDNYCQSLLRVELRRRWLRWAPPRDPWLIEFFAAVTLASAAERVSPELKVRVLEVALEQLSVAAAKIKEQMRAQQKK